MKNLLFYVNPAHLLLPERVEDVPKSLQFRLMVFQLLLQQTTVSRHMVVAHAQRRCVCSSQEGYVPMQFSQPFLHRHQLLAQLFQLVVEGPTVIGERATVDCSFRR